jgi:hypothetical protein
MPLKASALARVREAIVQAARQLHQAGLWVIPLREDKACHIPGWQNGPVPWQVLELMLLDCSCPTFAYGIGIVLNQSSLIDVEADSPEAEADIQRLCQPMPVTPTFQSGRGKHRLFVRPEVVPDKNKVMIGPIEVRGCSKVKGSLSEMPPTRGKYWLPGRSFWDVPVAPLPEAIAAHLRRKAAQAARQTPHWAIGSGGGHPRPRPDADVWTFPPTWTLLQHVMFSVLGQPRRSTATGRSTWACPYCNHETLYSFDHIPGRKDRFKCGSRGCDWWGDEKDILSYQASRDNLIGDYGHRLMRLERLREEHLRLCPDGLHPHL